MTKFYIAEYQGGAVYEPAEGGYYVPVSECVGVTVKAYKEKHARRVFLQAVKEYSEYYGEPACLTRNYARWSTGNYVGDEFEIRITAAPEKYAREIENDAEWNEDGKVNAYVVEV